MVRTRSRLAAAIAMGLLIPAPPALATTQGTPAGGVSQRRSAEPLRSLYEPPRCPPASPMTPAPCGVATAERSVNEATGEVFERAIDLTIAGRGLDFVLARTYRSRSGPANGPLGPGWTHSFDIGVELVGDAIVLQDGSGRLDLLKRQGDGSYACDELFVEGWLLADGSFELLFADSGRWLFRPLGDRVAPGRIALSEDRNGNRLTFEYDERGRLARVRDTLDLPGARQEVRFHHDLDGRLVTVQDFAGRVVTYEYAGAADPAGPEGMLRSATSPKVVGTPNGNDFPLGKTTRYAYSQGTGDARLDGNLLAITDPLGAVVVAYGYSAVADPRDLRFDRVETMAVGGSTGVVHYVAVPEIPSAGNGGAVVRCIVNDAVGNVRERSYDALNRLVLEREFTGRADPTRPTTKSANRPKNPLRPGDPPFFETQREYNADSKLVQILRPEGDLHRFVHELDLDPAAPRRARGNLREEHHFPGPRGGAQAEIARFYEYADGMGGCCGLNWVTKETDPRGNVTRHEYDARGNRVRTVHPIASIVEEFEYDVFGQLVAHVLPVDANGARRRDEYSWYTAADGRQNGRLESMVKDALGLALESRWEYDALGRVVRAVDPTGADVLLVHNALDQVVRAFSPEIAAGSGVRCSIDRFFDAADRLVRVDVQNRDASGSVAANARFTTTFDHDPRGLVVAESREIEAGRAAVTRHAYDANGNRVLTRWPEAVAGRQPGNAVAFEWDERDLLFRRVRGAGGATPSTTQFDWDGGRQLVTMSEGLESGARVTSFVLDGFDRRVAVQDAMGNVTTTTYDAGSNETSVREDGELVDVAGGAGNVRLSERWLAYDALDRLVAEDRAWFDAAGNPIGDGLASTRFAWSDASQLVQSIDDHGHVTVHAWDSARRETGEIGAAGDALQRVLDRNGRLVKLLKTLVSGAGGPPRTVVQEWLRDPLGRVVKEVDPAGHERTFSWDSRGLLGLAVDGRGNRVALEHDGLGRRIREQWDLTDDGTGSGQPAGTITMSFGWDDSSRLVTRTDPAGNVTQASYDDLDRWIEIALADGTRSQCAWNARDEIVSRTDANQSRFDSTRDALGRPIFVVVTPGPGVSPQTTFIGRSFDGLSRLVRAQDDDSDVTRSYDSLSNLLLEARNGIAVATTFDALGNLLATIDPGGRRVDRAYDAAERLVQISEGGAPLATWTWLGPEPQRIDRASGVTSLFEHDAELLPSRITHQFVVKGRTTVVHDRQFAYDATHHRTLELDLLTGASRAWSHDSAGRLVSGTKVDPSGTPISIQYLLDESGDRLQVIGGPGAGGYLLDPTLPDPGDAQAHQYTATPFDVRAYDDNGNLVDAQGAAPRRFAWDCADRLVEETDAASGARVTYAYDALGRRFRKDVQGPAPKSVEYVWSGAELIAEVAPGGVPLAAYDVGARPREVVAMERAGVRHDLLADDVGSTRLAMAQQTVVEGCEYDDFGVPSFFDAFGNSLPRSLIGNPVLFRGLRFESDDGIETLQGTSRLYDPRAGRFVQRAAALPGLSSESFGNPFLAFANSPQDPLDSFFDVTVQVDALAECDVALHEVAHGWGPAQDMKGPQDDAGAADDETKRPPYLCGNYWRWWQENQRGKLWEWPKLPDRNEPLYGWVFFDTWTGIPTIQPAPIVRDCCCVTWTGNSLLQDAQGYYGYQVRNVSTDSTKSCQSVCEAFGYRIGYEGRCTLEQTQKYLRMLFNHR